MEELYLTHLIYAKIPPFLEEFVCVYCVLSTLRALLLGFLLELHSGHSSGQAP